MSDSDKTYIGIKPCGCVTFCSIAGVLTAREEKAELKRVLRSGRRIEITTAGDARERLEMNCPHGSVPADVDAEALRLFEAAR